MDHKPPEAGAKDEAKPFDINKALNNAKFANYLSKFTDAEENLDNTELIQQRFEAYERKDGVAKEMQNFFRNQIEAETGIKLTPKELESIAIQIEEESVTNPEKIAEYAENFRKMKAGPAEIAALEARVATLTKDGVEKIEAHVAMLRRDEEDLWQKGIEDDKKREGSWRSKIVKEDIPLLSRLAKGSLDKEVARFNEELKIVDEAIGERESMLKSIEDAKEEVAKFKSQFSDMRTGILRDTALAGEVNKIAVAKVQEKLQKLMDPKASLESSEEGAKYLEKLMESRSSDSGTGEDYLAGVKIAGDGSEDALRKWAEDTISAAGEKKIAEVVGKLTFGEQALDKLTKSLEKYITKIGAKEAGEAKEFVVGALEKLLNERDKVTGPKRLLIKRLLITLTK